MTIPTEYMSFKNCSTISSRYDCQANQQRSQRRWCFSQTVLLWCEVLPDLSPALPGLLLALCGAPRPDVDAPSYFEGRQECTPRVWYSPEIDASKFTLHILSDTPGGFQWLEYILLMYDALSPLHSALIHHQLEMLLPPHSHPHHCHRCPHTHRYLWFPGQTSQI